MSLPAWWPRFHGAIRSLGPLDTVAGLCAVVEPALGPPGDDPNLKDASRGWGWVGMARLRYLTDLSYRVQFAEHHQNSAVILASALFGAAWTPISWVFLRSLSTSLVVAALMAVGFGVLLRIQLGVIKRRSKVPPSRPRRDGPHWYERW